VNDSIATQYGVNSIPKLLIIEPYEGKAVAEIPWGSYEGDMARLKQQLNAAATW